MLSEPLVADLSKKHRYPLRSYFILDCLDIIDGDPVGDWNWSQIFVPRGPEEATIPVMLGPDVARTYKIANIFLEEEAKEPGTSFKVEPVTDTLWLIRDTNQGQNKERIKFGVDLELREGEGDPVRVDPIIVNE